MPIPQFLMGTGMTVILNGNSSLCRGLPSTGSALIHHPFLGDKWHLQRSVSHTSPSSPRGFPGLCREPGAKGPHRDLSYL